MNVKIIGALIVALIIAGLTATLFYYRAEAATQKAEVEIKTAELKRAVDINAAQLSVIRRMEAQKKADDALLSTYLDTISDIAKEANSLRDQIDALKDSDDEVRKYLSTPVPPSLARLLGPAIAPSNARRIGSQPGSPGVNPRLR